MFKPAGVSKVLSAGKRSFEGEQTGFLKKTAIFVSGMAVGWAGSMLTRKKRLFLGEATLNSIQEKAEVKVRSAAKLVRRWEKWSHTTLGVLKALTGRIPAAPGEIQASLRSTIKAAKPGEKIRTLVDKTIKKFPSF